MTNPTRRPEQRTVELLDAALKLARCKGYLKVTREDVAVAAMCSAGTVSRLYGTMPQFRRAIMSAAVARRDLRVIAQGLAAKDPKAMRAPDDLKRQALETLL